VIRARLQEKHEHAKRVERKLAEQSAKLQEMEGKTKEYRTKLWGDRLDKTITTVATDKAVDTKLANYLADKVRKRIQIDEIEDEELLREKVTEELTVELAELEQISALLGINKNEPVKKTAPETVTPTTAPSRKFTPPNKDVSGSLLEDLLPDDMRGVLGALSNAR